MGAADVAVARSATAAPERRALPIRQAAGVAVEGAVARAAGPASEPASLRICWRGAARRQPRLEDEETDLRDPERTAGDPMHLSARSASRRRRLRVKRALVMLCAPLAIR